MFQLDEELPVQNSHLFQIKFSIILSSVIHMKNSLINYLEYKNDSNEQDLNKSCENIYERS